MKARRTNIGVRERTRGRFSVLIARRSGERTQTSEAAIERVERFAFRGAGGFDRAGEGAVHAGAFALRRRGVFILIHASEGAAL